MSHGIKHILEPYFYRLPELRGIPSQWPEFICQPAKDKDGYFTDANHQQRTNLLVALFYDQRTSDENLLRYLLRQEIEMHGKLPFQGVMGSIKINIGLLARFRHVDNIELFIKAREANFDTRCSLDAVSFVSPGVEKSYEHLPNMTEPCRNSFIETLGATPEECACNDDDVSEWIDGRSALLPASLDKLSLEEEIALSALLGESSYRDGKINDWIATIKKWDKEHCQTLYYYETMRGNTQGQIDALKKIGAYEEEKTLEKQMNYYHLSGLYLILKNAEEAHKNMCYSLNNFTSGTMEWDTCRMYAERFLDIILAVNHKDDPKSIDSFQWIKKYLDYQPWQENWDLKIIPKIMTASTIIGDNDTMKKFSDLFRARKQQQNSLMNS